MGSGEVSLLGEAYADLVSESDHLVVMDENNVPRWRADPSVVILWSMEIIDLDAITSGQLFGSHSNEIKELYRNLGFSLRAFIEIFDKDDHDVMVEAITELKNISKLDLH